MSKLKITELGQDFLLIQMEAYQPKVKVTVLVTEYNHNTGVTSVVSEKVEYREPEPTYLSDYYLFNYHNYKLMLGNFELGNCPVTIKGLARYCLAYGNGKSWYKCPARTAKQLVKSGVTIPKELYGLLTHILGSC